MQRRKFISEIAKETKLPYAICQQVNNAIIAVATRHLQTNDKFVYHGLFRIKKTNIKPMAARQIVNPKTNTTYNVPAKPASKRLTITASINLKKAVL